MSVLDYIREASALALGFAWYQVSIGAVVGALWDYHRARRSGRAAAVKRVRRVIWSGLKGALLVGCALTLAHAIFVAPYQMVNRAREEVTAAQKEAKWLYSEQPADLGGSSWKYGLRVLIQSNTTSDRFAVRLYTDKPIGSLECSPLPTKYGPFNTANSQHGGAGDWNAGVVECRLTGGISPDAPVMLQMFAKERFAVTKWERIQE
jgi:hypothetical protein